MNDFSSHTGPCPKCHYQRRPEDTAPAWQCPKCGVAYAKVQSRAAEAPRAAPRLRTAGAAIDDAALGHDGDTGDTRGLPWKPVALLVVLGAAAWFGLRPAPADNAAQRAEAQARLGAIDAIKAGQGDDQRFADARAAFERRQFDQALPVFQEYAGRQNPQAMLWLAQASRAGLGSPKDPAAARRWIEQASELGDSAAFVVRGHANETGEAGFPVDLANARHWYRKAAQAGSTAGLYSLGVLYAEGRGVMVDTAKAYALWSLSAEAFTRDAAKGLDPFAPRDRSGLGSAARLDSLRRTLSEGALQQAQALAGAWKADPAAMLAAVE